MVRYFIVSIVLFLLGPANQLICQTDFGTTTKGIEVYPVRVGHKIGFVKFFRFGDVVIADTMVAPRYDYIGDVNLPWNTLEEDKPLSPYRLFELDEKVGLLDPFLYEVLPNHYKRIRPLTEDYFAVETDSLFQLLDLQAGGFLFDGQRFDDIILLDTLVGKDANFLVKKGFLWGLYSASKGALIEPKYLEIQKGGLDGYYKARFPKNSQGWFVIDAEGRRVFKDPFENITIISEEMIAVVTDGRWQIANWEKDNGKHRFTKKGGFVDQVWPVNDSFFIALSLDPQSIDLWSVSRKQVIHSYTNISPRYDNEQEDPSNRDNPYFPWFFPLDDEHLVFCERQSRSGYIDRLMDYEGTLQSGPYSLILPSGKKEVYKVRRLGLWGVLAPGISNTLLLDCIFNEISAFNHDYALLKYDNKFGVLGIEGSKVDTLDWLYDKVSLVEGTDTLYVQLEGQTVTYYMDDGEFRIRDIYDNLSMVSKNAGRIEEAMPVNKSHAPSYRPDDGIDGELIVKVEEDTVWLHKMVSVQRSIGGFDMESSWRVMLPISKRPLTMLECKDSAVIAYSTSDSEMENPLMRLFFNSPVAEHVFYDIQHRTKVSTPVILGIRNFDQYYRYTAFIDKDGKMGLIDREGKECLVDGEAVRFTYIGPFVAGRARVCVGGQLDLVSGNQDLPLPYKYNLGTTWQFDWDFNITQTGKAPNKDQAKGGSIFAVGQADAPCRWAYIDSLGRILFMPEAAYVKDFTPDSTAYILRPNKRKDAYGHPDADYGVIDIDGQEILACEYTQLTALEEYFMITVDSTPTFFFTQKGQEIFVNPTRLRPFREGLAQFRNAAGQWGYVNIKGEVVIAPQYVKARPFSDGLALVADSTGRCMYVDTTGKIAFVTPHNAKQWRGIGDFHEGRAWFKGRGWSWGAYNKEGEVVIPTGYYHKIAGEQLPEPDELYLLPMDFSSGVAAVRVMAASQSFSAKIIDTLNEQIPLEVEASFIHTFDKSGIAIYTGKRTGLKGLVNHKGEVLCGAVYKKITPFDEGIARVQNKAGLWGLINQHGKILITPAYAALGRAAEGRIAVKATRYSGWSYIDYKGRQVIDGPFSAAGVFNKGVSLVVYDEQKMLIDRDGRAIYLPSGSPSFYTEGILGIDETDSGGLKYYADVSGNNRFGRFFEEISPFQLGVAKVRRQSVQKRRKELLGAINKRGVMIVPPKYRMLHVQPDGNIIINPQRFHGLADKKGHILLPPIYDRIEEFEEEGVYKVERGEKIGYFILDESKAKEVWPLQY
jgi:hypothetical protein